MSGKKSAWGWLGRLLVCFVLLATIFNDIFKKEGAKVWALEEHAAAWESLPRTQQWQYGWTHGPGALWRTLTQVEGRAYAESQFWMAVILLLGILRWRMVLRMHGLPLPWSRAISISMVAQFFNSFLLGSSGGDLLKAYYTARETHHKKTEAVVTVFVDRLIGLFSMLLFACVMMVMNLPLLRQPEQQRLAMWSGLILAMTVGCGGLVTISFWGGVSRGVPQARVWLRRLPKGEWIEKCVDACRVFGRDPMFLFQAMGVSMILNAVCVLQVMVLAKGLGLEVPLLAMFLIVPMIICISALPIAPPGGLGLREHLFVLLLAPLGVPETKALLVSLLAYSVFLSWSLLGGLVYLTLRHRQHLDEVSKGE